jgi:hypothetical protein
MVPRRYSHTQIGWVVLASIGGAILLLLYISAVKESHWIVVVTGMILAACLVLFGSLTVTGDERTLEVRFGPGPIRRRFALEDIQSYSEVTNHWYYGWGIRMTPHGWLFNVSGFHAVEIDMRNGSRYRIGTDDVQGLAGFLSGQGIEKKTSSGRRT